jgi:hypothetical protein
MILNSSDEIKPSVHVNIEIDKDYLSSVSMIANFIRDGEILFPLSTEASDEIRTVLYSEINRNKALSFSLINRLFLRIPKEENQETLNAIVGVSIFIGNKMFYFSHSDVVNLEGREQNGYMLYELPGLEYKKSIVLTLLKMPQWINWYGDFNPAVIIMSTFFMHPEKFFITWGFLICLIILFWPNIKNIYSIMQKQKFLPELLLLGFIVFAGFVLRFNGYVRHSLWFDELYSACKASSPGLPFMNTFEDPGNPPFYFILLRLWFMLFGWTEQSGRFFSVLMGSAAIISLYVMVKRFADKKTAFLAAVYMAISAYLVGFSQEMRPYILEVFLVSIVAFRFLIIIQEKELNFTDMAWYIIPSVLLVNTHYYGSLFVFVNFLFFIAYSVITKRFTWKKTVLFFAGNIFIAFSLLPYFIHTALQGALLDSDFNIWIKKPGLAQICIAAIIPLSGIIYIYLRRTVFQKTLHNARARFLDYAVFTTSAVYLIAFGISLYRPILITRYFVILYPLLIAVIAIFLTNIFTNSSKLIGGLCIGFVFVWIAGGYDAERGGSSDIYHESLAYISRDSEAHPQRISIEMVYASSLLTDRARFYGYRQLPVYTHGDNYDVLYINPLNRSEEEMYSETDVLGINRDRILRIRINDSKSVFKIYSSVLE